MKSITWELTLTLLLVAVLFGAPASAQPSAKTAVARTAVSGGKVVDIGLPPKVVDGPLHPRTVDALETLFIEFNQGNWVAEKDAALAVVIDSDAPRLAWIISDLMRFVVTPGLLIRSNKVMYDLVTHSVLDTFLGAAVTGPLARQGLQLKQATVVTTTWGEWKAEFPDTTVLAEQLALGRDFDFRNGRDADGPIFPIGNVDPRLGIQEDVLGVVTRTGNAIAFHVPSLVEALDNGDAVIANGVRVLQRGGGVYAVDNEGRDLGTHQAFWFAWSQFHRDTLLWPGATTND